MLAHSSDAVVKDGTDPAKAIPEVVPPAALKVCLAVFKSATSVQFVPFHSSVAPVLGGASPPKANEAVLPDALYPFAAKTNLCVFTLLTSVQLLPLKVSTFGVIPLGAFPAIPIADVAVPLPANCCLDVLNKTFQSNPTPGNAWS